MFLQLVTFPSSGFLLTKLIKSVHQALVKVCGSSTTQSTQAAALIKDEGGTILPLTILSFRYEHTYWKSVKS